MFSHTKHGFHILFSISMDKRFPLKNMRHLLLAMPPISVHAVIKQPLQETNCEPSAPARQHIGLEQVKFTGSPAFRPDGKLYIPNPPKVNYTGDPSPEIDRAGEELIWGKRLLTLEYHSF
jgi:hypothetical protein